MMKRSENASAYKSISRQFLQNYIMLFLLLLFIGLLSLGVTVLYNNYLFDTEYVAYDMEKIYEDIVQYDIEYAFYQNLLPDAGYIEILDDNLTVLDQYNSNHEAGFTYDQRDFIELLSYRYLEAIVYYPEDGSQMMLLFLPLEGYMNSMDIYGVFLITFILLLIAVTLIYTRITSVVIVDPIQHIIQGITAISNGEYGKKIDLNVKNELGDLTDKINIMSHKINEEISLRKKSESQRKQLILDISHDLRTPLTNIIGYSDSIIDGKFNEEEVQESLKIIRKNSYRANELIQDLFELSQLDMENYKYTFIRTDFCEFVRNIMVDYIPIIEKDNKFYDIDIPEDAIELLIDPQKMYRALSNIVVNFIKYSGMGTTLSVSLNRTVDHVQLIISDNGVGIPHEFRETIFEPFFRLDPARGMESGGTGLGLAITKKIIVAHRGAVSLDGATLNSRFTITLPLDKK